MTNWVVFCERCGVPCLLDWEIDGYRCPNDCGWWLGNEVLYRAEALAPDVRVWGGT